MATYHAGPVASAQRAGFALPLTLMVIIAIAVLASAATMMTATSRTIVANYARQDRLARAADEGVVVGRALINADPGLYPDTGFSALETNAPVYDGGNVVPGVTRSTYVGPIGIVSGEYGINGTVVSIAEDAGGARVIRREIIAQESFSKFAYFTNNEPNNISFGGGDQLFGPVHTNDELKIYSSGATFFGPVTTARYIQGGQYADFRDTHAEYANRIPMPTTADLDRLRVQAGIGGTAFNGDTNGGTGEASLRIEFVAFDLNNDGDSTDVDEGFFRVYRSSDEAHVVAAISNASMRGSTNCGDWHFDAGEWRFYTAAQHPHNGAGGSAPVTDDWWQGLGNANRRACYLGGAPELNGGFVPSDAFGDWVPWNSAALPRPVDARLRARFPVMADYLFPITRALNPAFKGVIHVEGKVAVSGVVRGRVTVAASDDIVIADDLTYSIDPSSGSCEDIVGLFAGGDVIVADTPINAPWRRWGNDGFNSFDDTRDEFIHAFVLTLNVFTVENYQTGATNWEYCQGTRAGRGCLYLTGGIIQETRGAVGLSNGSGYIKRYSYDPCGASQPPPYYPTTGVFKRGPFYDVDPTNFDVANYFDTFTAG